MIALTSSGVTWSLSHVKVVAFIFVDVTVVVVDFFAIGASISNSCSQIILSVVVVVVVVVIIIVVVSVAEDFDHAESILKAKDALFAGLHGNTDCSASNGSSWTDVLKPFISESSQA